MVTNRSLMCDLHSSGIRTLLLISRINIWIKLECNDTLDPRCNTRIQLQNEMEDLTITKLTLVTSI